LGAVQYGGSLASRIGALPYTTFKTAKYIRHLGASCEKYPMWTQ
jgi:hypothetical protein